MLINRKVRNIPVTTQTMIRCTLNAFDITRNENNEPVSWKTKPYSVSSVIPLVDALQEEYGVSGDESDKLVLESIKILEKIKDCHFIYSDKLKNTILSALEKEYSRLDLLYNKCIK